ncbi:hypothetical protein O181_111960 [Austropuccinia psidii MF-1]|uniref:Uncharacterized protein n=1 Tax=Austropuccinia psidii MF-1 TaxID=1389203 RepID=A0A9Q3K3G0_9BASI|nr:hypothetical protein [Austropuccinia psidii MF-1]
MQIIDEIKCIKCSIDVELGKFYAKLNKITPYINELKKNDRISAQWHKLTTARLGSISNKFDRIESKFQLQDYGMEDLSIRNINDQLKILKNNVLEIVNNKSIFATHLARSDNERQKLKDEIIAHVENIHKNYEPTSHIPRYSTASAEENLSAKAIFTPFIEENEISAKDIL